MALTDIEAGRLADNVFNVVGANKNLIINGAMQVAQRGTSSTTSGYGSVDRFHVQIDGGTVTHTQTAITSGSPYDEGFRSVLRLTNTATATGASNIRNPFQYIEAQNIAKSGWNYASSTSYLTLSFWVRSSVAQEFYGYLRTFDGTEQGYSFSLGSLSADTWTKVTKTIPGNSNLTFNNDNGAGLQVNISPFLGTDFTDSGNTVDTWAAFASGSRTPDYTNTWANTTNATFDITGVQLEVGSVATPFEHRSYGDELRRCQRYYETCYQQGLAPGSSTSSNNILAVCPGNINRAYGHLQFQVKKRAAATVVFFSTSGASGKFRNASQATDITMSAACSLGDSGISYEASSGIVSVTDRMQGLYTAEAEL